MEGRGSATSIFRASSELDCPRADAIGWHAVLTSAYIGCNAVRCRSGSCVVEARGQRRARRSRCPPATLRVCVQHESVRTAPGCRRHHAGMFDTTTSQTSNISVKIVQSQGSGVLGGTFTNTSTSQNYALNGTIDLQGNFHFTVQQPAGQQPRYFYGQVQQQGSDLFLKGFFCSGSTACNTKDSFFTAGPRF